MTTWAKPKYLKQHLQSSTHKKMAAANAGSFVQLPIPIAAFQRDPDNSADDPPEDPDDFADPGPQRHQRCVGLCLQVPPPGCRLLQIQVEMGIWASFCGGQIFPGASEEGLSHQYFFNVKRGHTTIVHRLCDGAGMVVANGVGPLCTHCYSLSSDRSLIRMIGRFFIKYMGARLLAARMFNDGLVEPITEEMQASNLNGMGFQAKIEECLSLQLPVLQRFVRQQFLCISREKWSRALTDFVESVVSPCLNVVAQACDPRLAGQATQLAKHLRQGTLSTVQSVELKLAAHVASGTLRDHPLIQGILCAAVEQAQRAKHGVHTMRNHKLSEVELSLMSQAGVLLSTAAGNSHLLKTFGLAFTQTSIPLDNLTAHSLPTFLLATNTPATLAENLSLIDMALRPHIVKKNQETKEDANDMESKAGMERVESQVPAGQSAAGPKRAEQKVTCQCCSPPAR